MKYKDMELEQDLIPSKSSQAEHFRLKSLFSSPSIPEKMTSTNQVYDGKVYVLRIKPTLNKVWEEDDVVYAVGYEGGAGLSFNAFKNLCENSNKKWFLSKKANKGSDRRCPWDEVEATLHSFPATGQQIITHTSSAVTFMELANMLYQGNIFTDSKGKDQIKDIQKKISAKTAKKNEKIIGPYDNAPQMIEKARADAEALAKTRSEVDTSFMPQGDKLLTFQYDSIESVEDLGLAGKTKEELERMVEELHTRLVSANEQIDVLGRQSVDKDNAIAVSEAKVVELNAQLDEVKTGTTGFMAAADLANVDKKRLSDSLVAGVVKGLQPFLTDKLQTLHSSVDEALAKVNVIDTKIVKAAHDIKNHANTLTTVIDTNHEAAIEKVEEVKNALALAGITAETTGPTIVESIASLSANIKETGVPDQEPQVVPIPEVTKHTGPCTWQSSDDQPDTLLCAKGCGSQLGVSVGSQGNGSRKQKNPSNHQRQYQQPSNQTSVRYVSSGKGYAPTGYQASFTNKGNMKNFNNNTFKRKKNFHNAGVRVQVKQPRPTEVSTQQYLGVPVAYPGGGNMQYVGYQQQQPVLPPHPVQGGGMVHAQVFHGGHAQPVLGAPLMEFPDNAGPH